MCLSPLHIPNPNYRPGALNQYADLPAASSRYSRYYKDVTSSYISVPCGCCAECRQARQTLFVQRSLVQSLDYHCIMITLTYKQEYLPKITFKTVCPDDASINETTFAFANHHDVQNMFKRIRNERLFDYGGHRVFKYMCASEYGKRKHRPHFHILLFLSVRDSDFDDLSTRRISNAFKLNLEQYILKVIKKTWCCNVGSKRKPIYNPLCDYVVNPRSGRSSYQVEYVRQKKLVGSSENDVAFYVSKYALKFDRYQNYLWSKLDDVYNHCINISDVIDQVKRYVPRLRNNDDLFFADLWNLIRPKIICSKFYGYSSQEQIDYVHNCVKQSHVKEALYPQFVNPTTGDIFGLTSYYHNKVLSVDDLFAFYDRLPEYRKLSHTDISHLPDERYTNEFNHAHHNINKVSQYNRICSMCADKYANSRVVDRLEFVRPPVYDMAPNEHFYDVLSYVPPEVFVIPCRYDNLFTDD